MPPKGVGKHPYGGIGGISKTLGNHLQDPWESSPRPLGIISTTLANHLHDPCESLPTPMAAIRTTLGKHPVNCSCDFSPRWRLQAPYVVLSYKRTYYGGLRERPSPRSPDNKNKCQKRQKESSCDRIFIVTLSDFRIFANVKSETTRTAVMYRLSRSFLTTKQVFPYD